MIDYREAAVGVAAALDDPERSQIGDPRQGDYKVSFMSSDMREAMQYARQLARLGISPITSITHDEFGQPLVASVNVWAVKAHAALLETVAVGLSVPRSQALEDLVLARSPIPDDLLEKIVYSHERGRTTHQIATRMNELDVMPGRGGKGWNAKKVKDALSEFRRRREQRQEAV
jgi:hypothetical protein